MTRLSGPLVGVLLATGCAGKYVPTPRMTSMRASMDKGEAAKIFARALVKSPTAEGICKAPFEFDDPRPTATAETFSIQAWRPGEEVGRTKQKDYAGKETTIFQYRKDRFVEERRFADINTIRVTPPQGFCSYGGARGKAAITLQMGRIEAPIVFAVDDLDPVLAALAVLAPQAKIVQGAGL